MLQVCRLCDVTLADASAWRQHFKSDAHVLKLRQKVADSASEESPVAPVPNYAATSEDWTSNRASPSQVTQAEETLDYSSSNQSADEDDDWEPPEFISDQCLFCDALNGDSLDQSLIHMETSHKFTIPQPERLMVEPETILWYLNLIIRGYHECILCSRPHSNIDAAQQHMRSTGHCRFEVKDDLADFYEEDTSTAAESETDQTTTVPSGTVQVDESSLRLPSGKILGRRASQIPAHSGSPRDSPRPSGGGSGPKQRSQQSRVQNKPASSSKELMTTEEMEAAALATNLSRFSAADQQWLSRLPNSEVRSLVLATWRDVSKSRREGTREKNRFMGAKGRTLMKHFRPSVPTWQSPKWG